MPRRALPLAGGLLPLLLALSARAAEPKSPPASADAEFFEKHVRPVLVESCVKCHGAKKQSGGLRLDSRAALLAGGDGGPAVVPGKPEESLLLRAIRHEGDLKMPPKAKLSPPAVDALAFWVKRGAPWPESAAVAGTQPEAWKRHWAFQPVRDPKPPAPKGTHAAWAITDIDRFVLATLEAKGLAPSPLADKRTLIRRVTFDLIGLPPTPEEVEAFLKDESPNAYEKLIDRLLASPHYGERWGRYWLDVARYSDTKGYVFFEEPQFPWAYTYRDYVIESFNADKPYDRFVLEQLAADRRPPGEDRRPLRALGLLTLGGRFMNNQHDIIDDRIDVVTRGLLGLTVTCARCHDHKYDPIPSKDYYSLYGVFASCEEPTVPPLYEAPPETETYAAFAHELERREQKLRDFVRSKHAELVRLAKARANEYLLAAHANRNQPGTEEFMLIADGSDLNPKMLLRWQVYLDRTRKKHHSVFAPWHAFANLPDSEFAAKAAGVCKKLAGPAEPGKPVNPLVIKAFAGPPPKSMPEVARRYGDLLNESERLRDAAISRRPVVGGAAGGAIDPARRELWEVFHGPDAPPDVTVSDIGDLALLPDRASQGVLQNLRRAVEQWRASGPGAPPRAMVMLDSPTPTEPRVFLRGNPYNLGEWVPRRAPAVLSRGERPTFHDGSGRLELAKAIASPENPLTARVFVNRVWLHHFGRGLVGTPSDFGLRSEPPSHPELLDYLASRFVADGWSVKKLHKRILLSAAYRQRSEDRPECRRVDPENVLLWRMNRTRLDFEAMRDALLAVAGRLDRTVGGPSVGNIWAGSGRRTLYGHIDRLNLPGLYRTFDFPSPDATSPHRDQTTVAPQALFLMNHPFVMECARNVLRRPEIAGEKDFGKKVGRVYHLLYGRSPTAEELALAREFVGEPAGGPEWERYVQALLVANEFVFVD